MPADVQFTFLLVCTSQKNGVISPECKNRYQFISRTLVAHASRIEIKTFGYMTESFDIR